MAAALPILSMIGTAMSVVGAISQASSQADAAEYNAKVAAANAQSAREQGAAAAEQQQRRAVQTMGLATANYGASGVSGDSGSALDVLQDSARQAELDRLTTKYNYDLRAAGYSNQAGLLQEESDSASTAGVIKGVSNGISGATDFVKAGYKFPGMD